MKKMKKLLSMAMILVLCIASMAVNVSAADADTLAPIREAFVDVQNKVVKTAGDASYNRVVTHTASGTSYDEVYLAKFDVSTIESATFSYSTFRNNKVRYTAIHVLKDVWTDTGVNFDNIQRTDTNKLSATGSGLGGYTVNHTVELTNDIIEKYIEADGTITLLVFIKYQSQSTSIDSMVPVSDAYKPSLKDISHKAAPAKFSFKKDNAKIQVSGNPVYVKDSSPNVDSFDTANEVSTYKQLNLSFNDGTGAKSFFTFDLTGIDKSKIDKFTFNLNVYVGTGSGNNVFYVKKVTEAWNEGAYKTEDTNLAAQWYGGTIGNISYSYDITDTVKNLEGDTLILLVEPKDSSTAGSGSVIRWNSDEFENPYIGVEYAVESITSAAEVTTSGTLYVEKTLVAGTAEESTPVTPILAVYDGDQLSNVNVGEELTWNGEETIITLDIPVNALSTGKYEVKFFIWDNLVSLVPLVEAEALN